MPVGVDDRVVDPGPYPGGGGRRLSPVHLLPFHQSSRLRPRHTTTRRSRRDPVQPDPAVAVAYKRAGWWGDTTVGDAVAAWAGEHPGRSRSSPTTAGPRGPTTTSGPTASPACSWPPGSRADPGRGAPPRRGRRPRRLRRRRAGRPHRGRARSPSRRRRDPPPRHPHRGRRAGHPCRAPGPSDRRARRPAPDRRVPAASPRRGRRRGSTPATPARGELTGRAYGADDLFLINSTSGTTGMPKCVMHTQNRWMYFHQLAAEAGDDDQRRRVPQCDPRAVRVRHLDGARDACGARRARRSCTSASTPKP